MNENTNRIDRLADEPWLAEVSDIVTLAERKGLTLTPSDVKGSSGDYVIDGMEWYEWLDAMTRDDDESSESAQLAPASGYTNCACRDCMDVAITGDDNQPALCLLCKDAGCEISYGAYMGGSGAHSTDCQRDDAYDVEGE